MSASAKAALLAALLFSLLACDVRADKKTVCTITVNSPDEKEIFRRNLPPDEYQFVELVERGRPDWLASSCRAGVRCDLLVVSGHFDGGTEFYTDRLDAREFLPVDEMERVACSDSCPGLFNASRIARFWTNSRGCSRTPSPSTFRGRSPEFSFAPTTRQQPDPN